MFWYRLEYGRISMSEVVIKNTELVKAVVAVLDDCPVECDGFSRLLSTVLTHLKIPHEVKVGKVEQVGVKSMDLHVWVEVDGFIADARLKMWFGLSAPHGVFVKDDHAGFEYTEKAVVSAAISPGLFYALSCLPLNDVLDKVRFFDSWIE